MSSCLPNLHVTMYFFFYNPGSSVTNFKPARGAWCTHSQWSRSVDSMYKVSPLGAEADWANIAHPLKDGQKNLKSSLLTWPLADKNQEKWYHERITLFSNDFHVCKQLTSEGFFFFMDKPQADTVLTGGNLKVTQHPSSMLSLACVNEANPFDIAVPALRKCLQFLSILQEVLEP